MIQTPGAFADVIFALPAAAVLQTGQITPERPGTERSEDESKNQLLKAKTRVSFDSEPALVRPTYSIEEYERRDDTLDPLSASLEYDLEKLANTLERYEVVLDKENSILGISVMGLGFGERLGPDDKMAILVRSLAKDGAAHKCGRIQQNDQILEVDGQSLVAVTYNHAANVLRNTKGKVKMVLGRNTIGPLEHQQYNSEYYRKSLTAETIDEAMQKIAPHSSSNQTRSILLSKEKGAVKNGSSAVDRNTIDSNIKTNEQKLNIDNSTKPGEVAELKEELQKTKLQRIELEIQLRRIESKNATAVPISGGKNPSAASVRLAEAKNDVYKSQTEMISYQTKLNETRKEFLKTETKLRNEVDKLQQNFDGIKEIMDDRCKRHAERQKELNILREQYSDSEDQYRNQTRNLREKINQLQRDAQIIQMEESHNVASIPLSNDCQIVRKKSDSKHSDSKSMDENSSVWSVNSDLPPSYPPPPIPVEELSITFKEANASEFEDDEIKNDSSKNVSNPNKNLNVDLVNEKTAGRQIVENESEFVSNSNNAVKKSDSSSKMKNIFLRRKNDQDTDSNSTKEGKPSDVKKKGGKNKSKNTSKSSKKKKVPTATLR